MNIPIVHITDSDGNLMARYHGPEALTDAEGWISGALLAKPDGEFNLDVSDAQCPSCEATFSAEAWSGSDAFGWYCPECGTRDRTQDTDAETTEATYYASGAIRRMGGQDYRALVEGPTGHIIGWVHDQHAQVVARVLREAAAAGTL